MEDLRARQAFTQGRPYLAENTRDAPPFDLPKQLIEAEATVREQNSLNMTLAQESFMFSSDTLIGELPPQPRISSTDWRCERRAPSACRRSSAADGRLLPANNPTSSAAARCR
mmetsp:Transcript_53742/g.89207  ORF Transcript_53742/g.89207 Transcript_53742/m.89207 type:complete len:113 (+) Transcript_53742:215-553(+)